MSEWPALTHQEGGAVLALRHRVIPMLNPPAFAEQKIKIVGDVSRGINISRIGLEGLVYDQPVTEFDSALREEPRHRFHAYTGHHHVCGNCALSRHAYRIDGAIAAK